MSEKVWMEIVENQDLAKAYLKKDFIRRVRVRRENLNAIIYATLILMPFLVFLKIVQGRPDSAMVAAVMCGLIIVFVVPFHLRLKHSIDSLAPNDEGVWDLDFKSLMSFKNYLTFVISQYYASSTREIDRIMAETRDIQKQRTRAQMHIRSLNLSTPEREDLEEMISDYDQRINNLEKRVEKLHIDQIELEKFSSELDNYPDSKIKWLDLKYVENRVKKVNEMVGISNGSQSGDNRVEVQSSVG